jgi:multidrug resistance efflux pump
MKKKLLLVLAGLVLIGVAILIIRVRVSRPAKPGAPEGTLAATAAGERPAARGGLARSVVAASGRIEPVSEEVVIGAEIPGRLVALLVEEGASVRRGQTLARLDDREYRVRLDSAEALHRQKAAELLRLRNGSREQERREARAVMREAEAVMENARTERDRRANLFRTGDIAREEVERADRQLEVARARHEAAVERYSLVDAPARVEDIARAEAELALAAAGVAAARVALEKTLINSPLDGVLLRRHQRVGEIVTGGMNGTSMPILTLADLSRLRVRAEIDELDVGRVSPGQSAWITIDAYGERQFRGRVVRMGEIFGRKTLRTDNPAEKVDVKILETLIDLETIADPAVRPRVGLRVNVFVEAAQ